MDGIGGYQFLLEFPQGNHGRLFMARPPERLGLDTQVVAVKVLAEHAGDDAFQQIANEVKLFAAIGSPYLVDLYDAGHEAGRLYYAMEYFPAGSLAIRRREFRRPEILRAVAHAARAAHALHEADVVHADIKPSNILMHDEGAKLSDLGLARTFAPGQVVGWQGPVGSIEFMDRRVALGEAPSTASDIWSLGVTLHRALSGISIYGTIPDGDVLAALRHVVNATPVVSVDLTEDEASVIMACLAEDPRDRVPTALGLSALVEALIADDERDVSDLEGS